MVQSNEDGISVPWILLSGATMHRTRAERRQRETHDPTPRRDPKEQSQPTYLCQGRRAVGMRVESHEKRPGRENVSGCCLSSSTTCEEDDDVTTNPDVCAGTVIGMFECDVHIPEALRAHFVEMQPVFKNICLTRGDLGPFMRRCAEKHHILATLSRLLVGSYRGD